MIDSLNNTIELRTLKWFKYKSTYNFNEWQNIRIELKEKDMNKIKKYFNKNLRLKQKICIQCGSIHQTFYDSESIINEIKELLQKWKNVISELKKYESTKINWNNDLAIRKERQGKIMEKMKMAKKVASMTNKIQEINAEKLKLEKELEDLNED